MIDLSREAGLPEPQFEQRGGFFVVTLWRGWLAAKVMAELGLNDRQARAAVYLKTKGSITNLSIRTFLGRPVRPLSEI
jgi:ATP-dependent DNA helicase RecG